MAWPDENHSGRTALDYARPSLQLQNRWRNGVAKTAILNMAFAAASMLISVFGGNGSGRIAVRAWVLCSALFGISYCILLVQVLILALRRNIGIQLWVSVWTIAIGLIATVFVIGFLRFMAML